jgi:monothiol glutaredoxin
MSPELRAEIDQLVQNNDVVLFMKGVPAAPQCGFSAKVVEILSTLHVDFESANVLESDELRQGIKEYTDWPTIPQLYVKGEFVGGADIIQDMYGSGELAKLMGVEHEVRASPLVSGGPAEPPEVGLTPSAVEAIQAAAAEEEDGDHLRVEISPLFEHGLFFDVLRESDVVVERAGVKLVFDPQSAVRAKDMQIDFVDNEERTGFKIDNPNKKRLEQEASQEAAGHALKAELPTEPPELTITEAANAQFRAAIEEEVADAGGEKKFVIRVGAKRMGATKVEYELGVIAEDEVGENDIEMDVSGVTYFVEPFSVRNLQGATIDFLDGSEGGASGFKFENPKVDAGWADPTAGVFQKLLDDEINPSIAAHGGFVELLDIQGDTAFVLMGGGCQGCGMASVTLSQGIEQRVREVIPQIQHLVDTTDHASGQNPYYSKGK